MTLLPSNLAYQDLRSPQTCTYKSFQLIRLNPSLRINGWIRGSMVSKYSLPSLESKSAKQFIFLRRSSALPAFSWSLRLSLVRRDLSSSNIYNFIIEWTGLHSFLTKAVSFSCRKPIPSTPTISCASSNHLWHLEWLWACLVSTLFIVFSVCLSRSRQQSSTVGRRVSCRADDCINEWVMMFEQFCRKVLISDIFMSSKDIVGDEKSEELLMTEKRKYPEVFKWKIAVIVIVVLIAVVLVVDLVMFIYLKNHGLRKYNYTFAADMVNLLAGTQITKAQFVNLIGGLTSSYSDIWFQNAAELTSWTQSSGLQFNIDQAGKFFQTKVTERITLIHFRNLTEDYIVGAFTNIPFQLPTDTWKDYLANASNSYYNFEIDEKESTLFGSNSETYLKMSGTSNNLAKCRIINFNQAALSFLQGAEIRLTSSASPQQAQLRFPDPALIEKSCFSTQDYEGDLQSAVGPIQFDTLKDTFYDLIDIRTYSLTT